MPFKVSTPPPERGVMELGPLTAELCLAYASLALIRWRQSERHLQLGWIGFPFLHQAEAREVASLT